MSSGGYVKIYGSILGSSIWAEPLPTRIVWITMLAMADKHGRVDASVSGLARFANVTADDCRAALTALMSADDDSKSPEHEGRRVEKVDGGWLILNYQKYRELQTEKQRADAERQAQHRRRRTEQNGTGDAGEETSDSDWEAVTDDAVTESDGRDVSQASQPVAPTAAATASATAKQEEEDRRRSVDQVTAFVKRWDFGRWSAIVAGFLRASRKPANVIAELDLWLTGEMGRKRQPPEVIGLSLNQYAAAGHEGFNAALFGGFVRGCHRQKDRHENHARSANEDIRLAQERREAEERQRDERDTEMLTRVAREHPVRHAELMAQAEGQIDRRFKGDARAVMVRDALIRIVRQGIERS